jgi:hypothetical protein
MKRRRSYFGQALATVTLGASAGAETFVLKRWKGRSITIECLGATEENPPKRSLDGPPS